MKKTVMTAALFAASVFAQMGPGGGMGQGGRANLAGIRITPLAGH